MEFGKLHFFTLVGVTRILSSLILDFDVFCGRIHLWIVLNPVDTVDALPLHKIRNDSLCPIHLVFH